MNPQKFFKSLHVFNYKLIYSLLLKRVLNRMWHYKNKEDTQVLDHFFLIVFQVLKNCNGNLHPRHHMQLYLL